ncbi:MAG: hypothetical protein KAI67_04725 [Candidatus Pacebacteria bacterium]|nr:hypothetical protein [Candidatus Paceibacterota bacterium]
MKILINRKVLLFMMMFSFFVFGWISSSDINVISVNVASAGCVVDADCGAGETIFNCKADCLPAIVPDKDIDDIIKDITRWTLGLGLSLSVIFLVWGGISYVGASGDAQKAETAKKVIKYSMFGAIVMGLSYALIVVVDTIFT